MGIRLGDATGYSPSDHIGTLFSNLYPPGSTSLLRIGAGLKKGTGDKYKAEWLLYISFCSHRGINPVPGRDVAWRIDVVARYLQ